LADYSEKWSSEEIKESAIIPENIKEDIQSAVGHAQLLLESKLPQFAELMYFYLSRHQDPAPVLPCDLEGYWAVAEISVCAFVFQNQ